MKNKKSKRRANFGFQVVPEEHDSATVLFTDIVNFTPLSGKLLPLKIFEFLSAIYTEFDAVVKSFADKSIEVCKVETIGKYHSESDFTCAGTLHVTKACAHVTSKRRDLEEVPSLLSFSNYSLH